MIAALLLHLSPAAASPLMGLDWVPLSRGDLTWIAADQSSGELVGELDGIVRPALGAYAGCMGDHSAWIASLGVAWVRTMDWTAEQRRVVSAATLRPELDWQRYLLPRPAGGATAWVGAGVHAAIPFASDRSGSYTEQESADAADGARAVRSRIGDLGASAGVGAEYRVDQHLTLGLRYHLVLHLGQSISSEGWTVSTLVDGEAALRVQVEFP